MSINSDQIGKVFNRFVDLVFGIILVFIILGITIGALQLFVTTWKLLAFEGITGKYINLIADVLTLFILIELSRSLVEYFKTQKIRLTYITDAAIVFVIREVMIGLFKHDISPGMLYAFSALLLVLGILRLSSFVVYLYAGKLGRAADSGGKE